MLNNITPVILTYNEEPNLERTLAKLSWAQEIIVVDSFSTDQTAQIAAQHPQVRFVQRKFDTHATQWNYGVRLASTDWVLSLDADYTLSDALIEEMSQLQSDTDINAYSISFQYCVFGKPLSGTLLPPRMALFKPSQSTYIDDGHTQLLTVSGSTTELQSPILHDDRKALSRWVWAQQRYVELEVEKLNNTSWDELSWGDRIRSYKVLAPFVILFYCLFVKRTILDGFGGWYYTLQRLFFEIWLSIRLIESSRSSAMGSTSNPSPTLNTMKA
ncbi:MAG: glycosyltransferase family 2 protein [Cyanobacteria bacterium P01_F01_bin.3]